MMAFMGWPYADAMAAFLFSFFKKHVMYSVLFPLPHEHPTIYDMSAS